MTACESNSKGMLWTGRILTWLCGLFLLMDGVMKLVQPAAVIEATTKLGYAASLILPLGVVLLVCTVLYLVPRTAVLGAILLTGYLGGAVNTHVRVGNPLFSHVLFPVYLGVMLWGGLHLRDGRLRALLPLREPGPAPTKAMLWTGIVLSALPVLLLLFSGGAKVANIAAVAEGFAKLGYPAGAAMGIGILELACTVLYVIPQTSVLGAVLLAGYLGGATATQLRGGEPIFTPILVGVAIWAALYVRDARLRALLPLRS